MLAVPAVATTVSGLSVSRSEAGWQARGVCCWASVAIIWACWVAVLAGWLTAVVGPARPPSCPRVVDRGAVAGTPDTPDRSDRSGGVAMPVSGGIGKPGAPKS
ncbi:hypothetical protein, partial [Mycobacterium marinum]|uniref:hypothetical protein n=1 Tax=Mycobacterium marinum TaxID=1781 RepID=UPI0035695CDE